MKLVDIKKFAKKNNLARRRSHKSGCYGTYHRLTDEVGVKVYFDSQDQNPKSIMKSCDWDKARNALRCMKKLAKYGLAPHGHAVLPVKYGNSYRVGLFMEHISGRQRRLKANEYEALNRKLKRHGVRHNDMGTHNWVVRDNKVVLIDWDFGKIRKKRK